MEDNNGGCGKFGCLAVLIYSVGIMAYYVAQSPLRHEMIDMPDTSAIEVVAPASDADISVPESRLLAADSHKLNVEGEERVQEPQPGKPAYTDYLWLAGRNYYSAETPDEAYDEGYDYGYEQGLEDGRDGEDEEYGFDDSCDYHGKMEEQYMLGYQDGYYEGYEEGREEYENNCY